MEQGSRSTIGQTHTGSAGPDVRRGRCTTGSPRRTIGCSRVGLATAVPRGCSHSASASSSEIRLLVAHRRLTRTCSNGRAPPSGDEAASMRPAGPAPMAIAHANALTICGPAVNRRSRHTRHSSYCTMQAQRAMAAPPGRPRPPYGAWSERVDGCALPSRRAAPFAEAPAPARAQHHTYPVPTSHGVILLSAITG